MDRLFTKTGLDFLYPKLEILNETEKIYIMNKFLSSEGYSYISKLKNMKEYEENGIFEVSDNEFWGIGKDFNGRNELCKIIYNIIKN